MGHRTLDDVRAKVTNLTEQQRVSGGQLASGLLRALRSQPTAAWHGPPQAPMWCVVRLLSPAPGQLLIIAKHPPLLRVVAGQPHAF